MDGQFRRYDTIKVKIVWIFLLIAWLAVGGCSPDTTVDPPVDNGGENGPIDIVLQGHTLEELGLELRVDNLQLFEDHNKELISYGVNHYNGEHRRFANMTGLVMDFSEKNGTEILLCIQGFKKPTNSNAQQVIVVDSIQYNLSELQHYMLYEDEVAVVYEIINLLPKEDFTNKVQDYVNKGFQFQWMLGVFEYVQTHEDIVIIRVHD